MSKDSLVAGGKLKREYIGFDLQASLHSGIGITTLRGEYITGTQPGTASITHIDVSPDGKTFSASSYTNNNIFHFKYFIFGILLAYNK